MPLDRYLLPLLDGTRDRDDLVEVLTNAFGANGIRIELDDEQESDADTVRPLPADKADDDLNGLIDMQVPDPPS